jgi:hypothetical protein
MRTGELVVAHTWDGRPIPREEQARLALGLDAETLRIEVDAPWHGDPPPDARPGPCMGLWEYEVVELFLLGDNDRYLEVELGPHGHHLVLELHGVRRVVRSGMRIEYTTARRGARWRGVASLPAAWVPAGLCAGNAYAIHGSGTARRHLACFPAPGSAPDFHRLEACRPVFP